tara:strand:- start:150 stop:401 length:252 start_codon:yes stop_codon:yes gene_type:complete
MLDTSYTVTTFAHDDATGRTTATVEFHPVIRRWVSHVSPERIDVKVYVWERGAVTTSRVVKLPEAHRLAKAYAVKGWRMEQWG